MNSETKETYLFGSESSSIKLEDLGNLSNLLDIDFNHVETDVIEYNYMVKNRFSKNKLRRLEDCIIYRYNHIFEILMVTIKYHIYVNNPSLNIKGENSPKRLVDAFFYTEKSLDYTSRSKITKCRVLRNNTSHINTLNHYEQECFRDRYLEYIIDNVKNKYQFQDILSVTDINILQ